MTGLSLSVMLYVVIDPQGSCELTRRSLWHNTAEQLPATVPVQLHAVLSSLLGGLWNIKQSRNAMNSLEAAGSSTPEAMYRRDCSDLVASPCLDLPS